MPQIDRKRKAAIPKKIENIDPKKDVRVRVLGTVVRKDEDLIILDDGSKTTEIFLDSEELEEIEEKSKIRVLGRVLPTPESFEIQGEIVQDMEELDIELYNEVIRD